MRSFSALVVATVLATLPANAQTASEIIDSVAPDSAVEKLAAGQYPEMKRDGALVGAIQRAWDGAEGSAGVFVARYSPEQVIKIRVREFMTTTLVLPDWETIATHVLGDEFGFKVIKTQPHILVLRSAITGADTSLTVVGDSGRVYSFYIRSEGYNSPNVPDVTVFVKADAPATPARPVVAKGEGKEEKDGKDRSTDRSAKKPEATKAAARSGTGLENPDFLTEIPFDPAKLRFDYTMTGDRSIAPDRIFSDGIFTYFDYGSRWDESDLPAVYRVVDGVDTPVNTRSKGPMLIAESAGAFTLKNGQRVVCVRPEGYVPDGSYTPLPKRQSQASTAPVSETYLP